MLGDSRQTLIALIAALLTFGLLIPAILPAVAQPPCDIAYMVISSQDQVVPGPLVAPDSYYVWWGWSSYPSQWYTYGPFNLKGGHKYLINAPLSSGGPGIWEDHQSLSPYPYPTSDVAAVYYMNFDEPYSVTVCP